MSRAADYASLGLRSIRNYSSAVVSLVNAPMDRINTNKVKASVKNSARANALTRTSARTLATPNLRTFGQESGGWG